MALWATNHLACFSLVKHLNELCSMCAKIVVPTLSDIFRELKITEVAPSSSKIFDNVLIKFTPHSTQFGTTISKVCLISNFPNWLNIVPNSFQVWLVQLAVKIRPLCQKNHFGLEIAGYNYYWISFSVTNILYYTVIQYIFYFIVNYFLDWTVTVVTVGYQWGNKKVNYTTCSPYVQCVIYF